LQTLLLVQNSRILTKRLLRENRGLLRERARREKAAAGGLLVPYNNLLRGRLDEEMLGRYVCAELLASPV
jgi:hypothetical protein